MKYQKVTNTSEESPFKKLLVGMGENGSGILAQEAQGQRELLNATQMPVKVNSPSPWKDKGIELYRRLGFTFEDNGNGVLSDSTIGDRLFVDCCLPDGWKKRGSDHSMWTYIDDHKSRERMSVFYKAAFYDRDAFINVNRRFNPGYELLVEEGKDKYKDYTYEQRDALPHFAIVKSGNVEVWRSEPITPIDIEHRMKLQDSLRKDAVNWLNEHYQNWEDVLAYWD